MPDIQSGLLILWASLRSCQLRRASQDLGLLPRYAAKNQTCDEVCSMWESRWQGHGSKARNLGFGYVCESLSFEDVGREFDAIIHNQQHHCHFTMFPGGRMEAGCVC